jgi:hypothetical protein
MIDWGNLINTFETGGGFWNPLIWGIVLLITFLVIYIIRGRGRKDFKKDTEQTNVFLSGNPELEKEKMHVKGSNVYWGFMESLKWLYETLDKMHTGNVGDYILWFVIIIGIFFIIIGVI